MTRVQVFKWFCKEHKMMSLMRELYYRIRPTKTSWRQPPIYLSFDEYIDDIISSYGFIDVLSRIEYSYFLKVGWDKYNEFEKKYDMPTLKRRWIYFVRHNICIPEDTLKVGDEIAFSIPFWFNAENNRPEILTKGTIKTIQVHNTYITVDFIDGSYRDYSINMTNLYNPETEEKLDIPFYIKRNRKKYYGADRK